ncbi:MAG: hypothetical protein ACI9FN_003553 [Saprospiraceae bacterium]|jgi:hypothetical protein
MGNSLLFLPDISGFTAFVQSTEAAHSQHVIAELLEVLVEANVQELQLAEVEGDALFFYKEDVIPSADELMMQVETMFTAFYSHLKLLETNRICPCQACATAPHLELKIIAHSGEIQFITVQGNRKPFGTEVIQVHRLMKNSVKSDNYVLFSESLANEVRLSEAKLKLVDEFKFGSDIYDNKALNYQYAVVDKENLKIKAYNEGKKVDFDYPPDIIIEKDFPISAEGLIELVTNYKIRKEWFPGVDGILYNEHEVTRIDSEHICVINEKHYNFITVTKEVEKDQLIYGELLMAPPLADEMYQFYIISPTSEDSCVMRIENYVIIKSWFKKLVFKLVGRKGYKKGAETIINGLYDFVMQ